MFRFSIKNKKVRSDRELMDSYRKSGDLETLGELYDRYVHLVYGVALKYLKDREKSKDAVMQIFENLIVEAGKKEIVDFQAWIYVVSRNYCLMELRKEKRQPQMERHDEYSGNFLMESGMDRHPFNEDLLTRMDGRLEKCMDKLPETQRKCIELFYFNEKCYNEIAGITRYDLKKVKSYIQNGKRNLKNCLQDKNE